MFGIVRDFIGCILLCCIVIFVRKSKIGHKRAFYLFSPILAMFTTALLFLVPAENLFITFSSPQDAYEYISYGKPHIELIVEGNSSDFIVDQQNGSSVYQIIPKTANGWKIGIGTDTKKVNQGFSDGISMDVYQFKNTNDYYITLLDINGGKLTISDCYNSQIHSVEQINEVVNKTFVTYYAHISDFSSEYFLTINGAAFSAAEGQE